jgi:hypothetical protein
MTIALIAFALVIVLPIIYVIGVLVFFPEIKYITLMASAMVFTMATISVIKAVTPEVPPVITVTIQKNPN